MLVIACSLANGSMANEIPRESNVGMNATIQGLILPGTELKVKPLTDNELPIVLRIKKSYVHGSDFRYDLVFMDWNPAPSI